PGPMEYIPNFIARKHGDEEVVYDVPEMEEHLKETYGITVYQEQVMLLSQKMAGFTKGQADSLRKAMGKKIKAMMDELYPLFLNGCEANNLNLDKVKKVWKDWEAFASYAFNKSHSTCYAFVAFQTAYLKANYPAEYMAAVMTHNMNDIKKVTFFMEECRRMKITVLGPSVNESNRKFTVNKKGEIRFALSAIKGVGDAAVEALIEERKENGHYESVFDLTKRVNLRTVNKKSLECMTKAGALDEFEFSRAQYSHIDASDNQPLFEKAIKYGNNVQTSALTAQNSLFGDAAEVQIAVPKAPNCEDWGLIERLNIEKELVGIYISGHPLDTYRLEMESFGTANTQNVKERKNVQVKFGGIVSASSTRFTKKGNKFCNFTIEDYDGSMEIFLFGKDFLELGHYVEHVGSLIFITGSYQARKYNQDEFEFKISKIELLDDLKDKADGVRLFLDTHEVTPKLITSLKSVLEKHKGHKSIQLEIKDNQERLQIEMRSHKYRVEVSTELTQELTEECGVKCELI
ncbi:MAG: OB-fold nucleic acid binding domain-containing protein, partial [Chitinophagales bacterium]